MVTNLAMQTLPRYLRTSDLLKVRGRQYRGDLPSAELFPVLEMKSSCCQKSQKRHRAL